MSKPVVYDQFDKSFSRVSAYVILGKSGDCVAKIAFKFPADGAGRLYAYVHWLGIPMVRGQASGYGYDKRSAAVANAVRKLVVPDPMERIAEYNAGGHWKAAQAEQIAHAALLERTAEFVSCLEKDGGEYWDTRLRNAGFNVIQAI